MNIDLVADIGESFGSYAMGDDERILNVLTSANVACGFHAGDPLVMERTVRACMDRGVAIGAHPGFRDLVGFGRRTVEMSVEEIRADVLYQIGALSAFVQAQGGRLNHVSPHGRLGNLTVVDEKYATGVLDAIELFDPNLIVAEQPGLLLELARARGLRVSSLAFPDRNYESDGTLVSRREPDAVLHDPDVIAARAVKMATTGAITARTGERISIACTSISLHGDNQASITAAYQVRSALEAAGVDIVAMTVSAA